MKDSDSSSDSDSDTSMAMIEQTDSHSKKRKLKDYLSPKEDYDDFKKTEEDSIPQNNPWLWQYRN